MEKFTHIFLLLEYLHRHIKRENEVTFDNAIIGDVHLNTPNILYFSGISADETHNLRVSEDLLNNTVIGAVLPDILFFSGINYDEAHDIKAYKNLINGNNQGVAKGCYHHIYVDIQGHEELEQCKDPIMLDSGSTIGVLLKHERVRRATGKILSYTPFLKKLGDGLLHLPHWIREISLDHLIIDSDIEGNFLNLYRKAFNSNLDFDNLATQISEIFGKKYKDPIVDGFNYHKEWFGKEYSDLKDLQTIFGYALDSSCSFGLRYFIKDLRKNDTDNFKQVIQKTREEMQSFPLKEIGDYAASHVDLLGS